MDLIKKINESKSIWQILPTLTEDDLEEIITTSADSYHNSGISLLTDEIFDILVEKLKLLNPKSKIFTNIGAEVKGKKVKLPYWMGSMDKIKTEEKLIDKWTAIYEGPYLISDKLDGISCLVTIDPSASQTRNKIALYTRGNGIYGQNITHLYGLINMSIEKLIKMKTNGKIAVRGELIMTKESFKAYENEMSNARNMVAGIVNSKKESVNLEYASHVDFIAYEIIEPFYKPSDQMKMLENWKLNVVYYDIYDDIDLNILDGIFQKRKKKSIYEIDGLIVTDNKQHSRNVSGNPSYSFAYKGLSQTTDTKVIEILWKPSKDGVLVPRIHFEKVRLSQADLEYTTGFNAKYIVDNKLGPGAIITVIRSGDVIPYIMNIVKSANKPDLPKADYKWDKNHVNIVLNNADENETVIIQRLTKFVRNIGVDNLSEGLITRLVENGYDTIPKIVALTTDDFLSLEGFKETLANKLFINLNDALKKLNILTLMVASNIFGRGFGERKLKSILDAYPDIVYNYSKKTHDSWEKKLLDLDGFDTITVNSFLKSLPDFQKFYDKISKITDILPYKNVIKKNGLFENQTIVFTGFRDPNWKKFIESEGGKTSGSVSGRTSLLVYNDGEESSGKYQAAKKLGIKTISKSEFSKKYRLK